MTKRVHRHHVSFDKSNGKSLQVADGDFPGILKPDQAAKLLQTPVKTIYLWLKAGRLNSAARKRGRRWYIYRDALVELIFNGADW